MNTHDIYRPFLRYFRTKRMRQFRYQFRLTTNTRVLDVGGTVFNWSILDQHPKLIVLNARARRGTSTYLSSSPMAAVCLSDIGHLMLSTGHWRKPQVNFWGLGKPVDLLTRVETYATSIDWIKAAPKISGLNDQS